MSDDDTPTLEDSFTITKSRVTRFFALAFEVDERAKFDPAAKQKVGVLLGVLDRSRDVLARHMEKMPDARIFSRNELRAFVANLIAEIVLEEGQRIVKEKDPC